MRHVSIFNVLTKVALSASERVRDPSWFLIGQKNYFNFSRFSVVFHNELSCVFEDLYLGSKRPILCF